MGDTHKMIIRKKWKRFLQGAVLALTVAGLTGVAVEAEASQSSLQVTSSVESVSGAVGDVVEIPVKISTKQALRGFSGKLSGNYDESMLEFQGLDTKELPADAMLSVSGGNFSYLSSSGDHTFSNASYALKFRILQASADPVNVTIQDLYYTDGNVSSEKVSLTATVSVSGAGNGSAGGAASNGTGGTSDGVAGGSTSNAGAASGNSDGTAGAFGQNGTDGSQGTSGSIGNAADSAQASGQQGDENADAQNDVAVTSLNPEDGEGIPVEGSSDTGASDTGKMARGTAKSGSAPVAVIVIVVLAAAVIGIAAGVKISKKRK